MIKDFLRQRTSPLPLKKKALMQHEELRQVLDAMVHAARLSFEKTNTLLPFAIALSEQQKIRQLALAGHEVRLAEATARAIETGLKLIAQQTTCKAVGLCSEIRLLSGSQARGHAEIVFLLEHRDGCAYRVVFPDFLEPKNRSEQRTEPRFFMRPNGKFLQARHDGDTRRDDALLAAIRCFPAA